MIPSKVDISSHSLWHCFRGWILHVLSLELVSKQEGPSLPTFSPSLSLFSISSHGRLAHLPRNKDREFIYFGYRFKFFRFCNQFRYWCLNNTVFDTSTVKCLDDPYQLEALLWVLMPSFTCLFLHFLLSDIKLSDVFVFAGASVITCNPPNSLRSMYILPKSVFSGGFLLFLYFHNYLQAIGLYWFGL